ncbi:MAG: hypothetical protein SGILL_002284 [Bacillariaceae sp.]
MSDQDPNEETPLVPPQQQPNLIEGTPAKSSGRQPLPSDDSSRIITLDPEKGGAAAFGTIVPDDVEKGRPGPPSSRKEAPANRKEAPAGDASQKKPAKSSGNAGKPSKESNESGSKSSGGGGGDDGDDEDDDDKAAARDQRIAEQLVQAKRTLYTDDETVNGLLLASAAANLTGQVFRQAAPVSAAWSNAFSAAAPILGVCAGFKASSTLSDVKAASLAGVSVGVGLRTDMKKVHTDMKKVLGVLDRQGTSICFRRQGVEALTLRQSDLNNCSNGRDVLEVARRAAAQREIATFRADRQTVQDIAAGTKKVEYTLNGTAYSTPSFTGLQMEEILEIQHVGKSMASNITIAFVDAPRQDDDTFYDYM